MNIDPEWQERLARASQMHKEAGQMIAKRLNGLWNPETRKYEPHEEMVFLHDLINKMLATTNFLHYAERQARND